MLCCHYNFCLNKVKDSMRKNIKSVSHLSRGLMLSVQPVTLEQEEERFALFLAANGLAEGQSVLFHASTHHPDWTFKHYLICLVLIKVAVIWIPTWSTSTPEIKSSANRYAHTVQKITHILDICSHSLNTVICFFTFLKEYRQCEDILAFRYLSPRPRSTLLILGEVDCSLASSILLCLGESLGIEWGLYITPSSSHGSDSSY